LNLSKNNKKLVIPKTTIRTISSYDIISIDNCDFQKENQENAQSEKRKNEKKTKRKRLDQTKKKKQPKRQPTIHTTSTNKNPPYNKQIKKATIKNAK